MSSCMFFFCLVLFFLCHYCTLHDFSRYHYKIKGNFVKLVGVKQKKKKDLKLHLQLKQQGVIYLSKQMFTITLKLT